MPLLSSTAATRMVPVAGRQMAERRLGRGVGAAERAVGNAWGRLTSRQREHYGSQRNFADGLQRESNRRAAKAEEEQDAADRERGRQDALGSSGEPATSRPVSKPATPVTNHAKEVINSPSAPSAPRPVDPALLDKRGFGNPVRRGGTLEDAVRGGRIKDTFGKDHAGFQQESHRRFAQRRLRPKTIGLPS